MLSDDGAVVASHIIEEIEAASRCVPGEISLRYIEGKTGVRVQNIGMAYDPYIRRPLEQRGISSRKVGSPVRIELSRIEKVAK